jgi:hypothetical protein
MSITPPYRFQSEKAVYILVTHCRQECSRKSSNRLWKLDVRLCIGSQLSSIRHERRLQWLFTDTTGFHWRCQLFIDESHFTCHMNDLPSDVAGSDIYTIVAWKHISFVVKDNRTAVRCRSRCSLTRTCV